MLKDALQFLFDQAQPEDVEIEGRTYTPKALKEVRPPKPAALEFTSLQGLVDYVSASKDFAEDEAAELTVQVVDEERVVLFGPLSPAWREREFLAVATTEKHGAGFQFGRFMDSESFNIGLQSSFEQTDDRVKVLKLVGSLKAESVHQSDDDGVTQTVTVKKGVALSEKADVPNPVVLAHYRTFREVAQPESKFVLRVKKGSEHEPPSCALFEADGGAWKIEAIKRTAEWLKAKLPKQVAVLS